VVVDVRFLAVAVVLVSLFEVVAMDELAVVVLVRVPVLAVIEATVFAVVVDDMVMVVRVHHWRVRMFGLAAFAFRVLSNRWLCHTRPPYRLVKAT